MIGVVLVTQGSLGVALRETMEHVVGPQTQLETVSVGAGDDIGLRREELARRVREVDDGHGVMLVTDMFGSTPSNLAVAMARPGEIEVLGGVNLPMLVKLAQMRGQHDLTECTVLAEQAGRKYISCASDLPAQCREGAKRCAESGVLRVVPEPKLLKAASAAAPAIVPAATPCPAAAPEQPVLRQAAG